MTPVKSSNVAAVGYDQSTLTLTVQFKDGATYSYHDFPPEAHSALMAAESVGKHLAKHVKGKYLHKKVSE